MSFVRMCLCESLEICIKYEYKQFIKCVRVCRRKLSVCLFCNDAIHFFFPRLLDVVWVKSFLTSTLPVLGCLLERIEKLFTVTLAENFPLIGWLKPPSLTSPFAVRNSEECLPHPHLYTNTYNLPLK